MAASAAMTIIDISINEMHVIFRSEPAIAVPNGDFFDVLD
jgi:hypothetical protein